MSRPADVSTHTKLMLAASFLRAAPPTRRCMQTVADFLERAAREQIAAERRAAFTIETGDRR